MVVVVWIYGLCLLIVNSAWTFKFKWFIQHAEPIGGEITVACESGIVTNAPKTAMEKALDEQMNSSKFLTSVDNSQSRRCYYTSIPRVIKQKGMHGQELTSLNID